MKKSANHSFLGIAMVNICDTILMRKLIVIFFFSTCYCQMFAQGFSIALPPKPNAFTNKFLTIINDASNDFKLLKR
jgi:hypothetical protein